MSNIQNRIAEAIDTTRQVIPSYFENTVKQRLPKSGAGSVVIGFDSAKKLEKALIKANWESYSHKALMAGTEAFITKDIQGQLGVVNLVDLPTNTVVTLDDRKNTGKVSCTVESVLGQNVDFTIIIIGQEQGEEVVFTFHPGEPVRPSQIQTESGMHGQQVAVSEAISMGLEIAKII